MQDRFELSLKMKHFQRSFKEQTPPPPLNSSAEWWAFFSKASVRKASFTKAIKKCIRLPLKSPNAGPVSVEPLNA